MDRINKPTVGHGGPPSPTTSEGQKITTATGKVRVETKQQIETSPQNVISRSLESEATTSKKLDASATIQENLGKVKGVLNKAVATYGDAVNAALKKPREQRKADLNAALETLRKDIANGIGNIPVPDPNQLKDAFNKDTDWYRRHLQNLKPVVSLLGLLKTEDAQKYDALSAITDAIYITGFLLHPKESELAPGAVTNRVAMQDYQKYLENLENAIKNKGVGQHSILQALVNMNHDLFENANKTINELLADYQMGSAVLPRQQTPPSRISGESIMKEIADINISCDKLVDIHKKLTMIEGLEAFKADNARTVMKLSVLAAILSITIIGIMTWGFVLFMWYEGKKPEEAIALLKKSMEIK